MIHLQPTSASGHGRLNHILGHLTVNPVAQPPSEKNRLSAADRALLEVARKALESLHSKEDEDFRMKHFVLAALRTESDKIFIGVNIKTRTTRASICAESIAVANAIANDPKAKIVSIVIVMLHPKFKQVGERPSIATPCGICRELLITFAPNSDVIINSETGEKTVSVKQLLPYPYKD